MPVVLREIVPGFQVLDCDRLHAALSPIACADNFLNRKAIACADCPIGAEVTGRSAAKIERSCVRCNRTDLRLIGHSICVGCFNRQREFVIGRNAKGQFPVVTARRLHHFTALVEADEATIRDAVASQSSLLNVKRYGRTGLWLTGITTGAEEISRLVERKFPGAVIADFEVVRES